MATTKKQRPRKVASSEPAAAAKVDAPMVKSEPPTEPKVVEKETPTKRGLAKKTGRVFHIHLIEGATYGSRGFDFTAGRPLITSDEKVYEAFRSNGRLRIDVREGGAQ